MSRDGVTWTAVQTPAGRLFEGPLWVPGARAFQWVDILSGTLHRWDPYQGGASEDRQTGLEFASMALPLDADRVLVASRSSLHVYSWRERTLETVGQWTFPADVRFNDGAIAPNGDVYVGTMSMERRMGVGALYRFDLSTGSLVTVQEEVGISNGLWWDADMTGYYVDSLVPQVDRITLVGDEVVRSAWVTFGADDEPDGLTVASDGTLLVALWGGSRIVLVGSPDTITEVSVPAAFPTSVALGGVYDEFVIVTTALGDEPAGCPGQVLVASSEELLKTRAYS